MEQFKRVQIILLETNNKSNIWSHKGRRLYYNQNNPNDVDDEIRYNIYIISDDEIKEGDWVIHIGNPYFQFKESMRNLLCNDCKKITATTDTSLILYNESDFIKNSPTVILLPQPSQQFITKYIEKYNKGNIITDVLVEYETLKTTANNKHFGEGHIYAITNKLKINPKDNTITIKKLKDSWNREEVSNLIKLFANNYQYASNDIGYNKWIEENL